jgi:predicted permease
MNIPSVLDRIAALFRKKRIEDDLDDEIRAHIEMAAEENRRRGMSLQEARHAAMRSFGGIEQMKEAHREARGLPRLECIAGDIRFAMRSLLRKPGFTAITAATLALGIGSCTIVFSVINAVLLTPLPYPNPGRLVLASGTFGSQPSSISPPDFLDYRAQNRTLSQFAAMGSALVPMTLTGIPEPQKAHVAFVSGNFFDVFELRPVLGRGLTNADESGTASVAVIAHGLWQTRYGGRENIIGDTLHLDGKAFTIAGVMPKGFRFPNPTDVWIPIVFDKPEFQSREAHQFFAIGRLREGVPVVTAQQDMSVVADRLAKAYPDTDKGFGLRVVSMQQELMGFLKDPLLILFAAVGLLLLLACANAANLILSRGSARRRELATRAALGAGRARLMRLLMMETTILALAGGVFGVLSAIWVVPLLAALPVDLIPGGAPIPGLSDTTVDLRVLGFTGGVSVLTALIVGLLPAFQNTGLSATEFFRSSSAGIGRYHRQLASKALVVLEVAISLTLLIGASLVFRSLLNVLGTDPGFNPTHTLTLKINPIETDRKTYFVQLLGEVTRIPGVQAAAVVSELPLSGYGQEWYFDIEHRPALSRTERPIAGYRRVSSDYFRAMGIPLRRGRWFTANEVERTAPVVIVDQRLAEMYFPGEDPLGKRIIYETGPHEIVGMVGNVLHYALFQELFFRGGYPTAYVPDVETGGSMPTLIVRASGSTAGIINPLRETLRNSDKNLSVSDIQPYEEILSAGLLLPRLGTLLFAVFAAIGMVLAVVGLYGVLSFSTARRTSEIGLRMALGSSRRDVVRLVVSDGMKLAIPGVLFGLAGAYAFARLLGSVLVRISSTDPVTFATVSLLLLAAAFCASYIPARSAANTDPARTLRHD